MIQETLSPIHAFGAGTLKNTILLTRTAMNFVKSVSAILLLDIQLKSLSAKYLPR